MDPRLDGFDREGAASVWRYALLSRGGLTVADVDELQDHLEQVEPELLDALRPEEAFWVAAHRVGTPEALTREYRKVRPNAGWLLRAQWALLGLLAQWLLAPAASVVIYALIAVTASVPALATVAAAGKLYAGWLALVLTAAALVYAVRRWSTPPESLERALQALDFGRWWTLFIVLAASWGWLRLTGLLAGRAVAHTNRLINVPGAPAALQSELWYTLASALNYALPAFAFMLVLRLQRLRNEFYEPQP